MRRQYGRAVLLIVVMFSYPCFAYELTTHAKITDAAYKRSSLASDSISLSLCHSFLAACSDQSEVEC